MSTWVIRWGTPNLQQGQWPLLLDFCEGLAVALVATTDATTTAAHHIYVPVLDRTTIRQQLAERPALRDAHAYPAEALRLVMLEPWDEIDEADWALSLYQELQRELSPTHPLYGLAVEAIATRQDNDDVLFRIVDGRYAWVHLTWARREETPPWPEHALYANLMVCWQKVLLPDIKDWEVFG